MSPNPGVVFTKPCEVKIDDLPMPEPGAGEVLIETRRTLISTGTELTILSGEFPKDSAWSRYGTFPFRPGYCNAGVVVDVGRGVDGAWKGKRVANSCQHQAYVTAACVAAPGASPRVMEIPEGVSDEEAAFYHLAANTVMNGVRRARLEWGEAVVIYGLGLLGQLAARFCALSGARPVLGVDVAPERLALLPAGPAFLPINGRTEDAVARVKEATGGRMADVVFEVTGNAALIPKEFALVKRQGRFVMLSSPRGATNFDFHDLCNAPSITIIGAHGGSIPAYETPYNPWTRARNGELLFRSIAAGELDFKPLISHRETWRRAPEVYKRLLEDRSKAMGVILEWR